MVTSLTVCHLPFGPTARFAVVNATTRHDVGEQVRAPPSRAVPAPPHPPLPSAQGTMSEQVPHLIFDGFQTELVRRHPPVFAAPTRAVTVRPHLGPPAG